MSAWIDWLTYLFVILRNDLVWLELILLTLVWAAEGRVLKGKAAQAARLAGRFAARRYAPYMALAAAAVTPRLILLLFVPPADPYVPDEFSHRFLADTLLSGRLSNPTHPLWQHFETIHIFHTPTYSSMYVPGQALFLAAGKLLTGSHWAGVLAGAMLAAASMLWMLRALFPPEWAFLGATFYTWRICMFSAWTEGYWGGHVSAAAGALLVGSAARLRREPRTRWAVIFALAVTLLAWTRPFEGGLMTLATGSYLLAVFLSSNAKRLWLKSVALPAGFILLTAAAATAVYCKDVTGSPVKLPYSVNRELYGWPMTLPWMKPVAAVYRHQEHALYFAWESSEHEKITSLSKIPQALVLKFLILFSFYLGPLMAWPLFFRWRINLVTEDKALILLAGGAVLCGVLIEQTTYPHYPAPAAAVLYAMVTASWKAIPEKQKLFNAVAAIVLVLAVVFVGRAAGAPISPIWQWNSWCDPPKHGYQRASIQRVIEERPGNHVAIVKYNRSELGSSWVFNAPDIDSQRLIWAQDMGDEKNQELVDYYRDRTFWIVEPDANPPRAFIWKTPQERR